MTAFDKGPWADSLGVARVILLGPGDDAFSAVAALPTPAPRGVVGARHSDAAPPDTSADG